MKAHRNRNHETPARAAFVLSAPGGRGNHVSHLAEKSLQGPCRRLQWSNLRLSDKIGSILNLGDVLARLWGQSAVACAVWAWVTSAETFPAFPPP